MLKNKDNRELVYKELEDVGRLGICKCTRKFDTWWRRGNIKKNTNLSNLHPLMTECAICNFKLYERTV
jgi:hypothetical protein